MEVGVSQGAPNRAVEAALKFLEAAVARHQKTHRSRLLHRLKGQSRSHSAVHHYSIFSVFVNSMSQLMHRCGETDYLHISAHPFRHRNIAIDSLTTSSSPSDGSICSPDILAHTSSASIRTFTEPPVKTTASFSGSKQLLESGSKRLSGNSVTFSPDFP